MVTNDSDNRPYTVIIDRKTCHAIKMVCRKCHYESNPIMVEEGVLPLSCQCLQCRSYEIDYITLTNAMMKNRGDWKLL